MFYAFNVCLYSVTYICVCCLRGVINDDDSSIWSDSHQHV